MTKRLSSSRTFIFLAVPELPKTATGKVQKYILRGKQIRHLQTVMTSTAGVFTTS